MFFLDKAKRKVRHHEEIEASQLGWHPAETSILLKTIKYDYLKVNFIL